MSLTVGELVAYFKVDKGNSVQVLSEMRTSLDTVEKAALKAEQAENRVAKAQQSVASSASQVAKAEAALSKARAAGNPDKVAQAEERLAKAKTSAEGASLRLRAAEQSQSEARTRLATATDRLSTSQAKAAQESSRLDKALQKVSDNEAEINSLSNTVGGIGLAAVASAGLAIKKFADFDQQMSVVASTGDDARQSIDALGEAAIQAGADTAFSATEAAGAVEELAKAGVTAKDILSGGLKGSLDLAAAGGIGVAEAAEYASIAMAQFNLGGKDTAHIADLLAAGAGKAMGGVSDLGQALKQGGLVASATGLTLEETTATLAAFAQAGLLGSDAGTAFKTMLQRLSAPTGEAADLMETLRISAYGAGGEFVGMGAFARQLTDAFGQMTPAARNAAMATIFGQDAVRAANVVYSEGEEGIRDWIAAVNDQGYASDTARTRLDNLKGDLEALGGSLETALIRSGSGANDVLRTMVQRADAVVDAIGNIPGPVLQVLTVLTGAGGLTALGVAGLGKLVVAFNSTRTAAKALGITAKTTSIAVGGIGAAIGVATLAFTLWADQAAKTAGEVDAIGESLDAVTGKVTANTTEIIRNSLASKEGFGHTSWGRSAFDDAEMLGIALDLVTEAASGNAEALKEYRDRAQEVAERTREMGVNGELTQKEWVQQEKALSHVTNAIEYHTGNIDEAIRVEEQHRTALAGGTDELGKAATATDFFAKSTERSSENLEQEAEAADQAWASIKGLAEGVLNLRDAERGYEAALDDVAKSVKEHGENLDIDTEAGRANQETLDALVEAGWRRVDSLREQGASEKDLQGDLKQTRKDFIKAAQQMGLTKDEAKALADQMNLIPSRIKIKAEADTEPATKDLNLFMKQADGLSIRVPVTVVGNKSVVDFAALGAMGKADGGSVIGPGTGTSDSILARLSNGEHVWTAREVLAAGGHGRLERMRAAAIAGTLPAFAAGGAVGSAQDKQRKAKKVVERTKSDVKSERKEAESAQKRYDRIDGTKANRAAKKDAKEDLKAQKKRLKAAEDDLSSARDSYKDAQERTARLLEESKELQTSVRRGTFQDGVNSGLSGAYSAIDELLSMADNKDISAKRRSALRNTARLAEKELTSLYKQAASTEKSLAEARDHAQELASIKASASSVLAGGFSLGADLGQKTQWGHDAPVTARSLTARAQAWAGKLKALTGKLDRLAAAGVAGAILRDIAAEGVDGGTTLADALLADPSQISLLNGAYADIAKWSDAAGTSATKNTTVGDKFYENGVTQADANVKSLQASLDSITANIAEWGVTLERELLGSLGLNKDNKGKVVKKALGGAVVGGTPGVDSVPILAMPDEHMWTAEEVRRAGGHAAVYRIRQAVMSGAPAVAVASGSVGASSAGGVGSGNMQVRFDEEGLQRVIYAAVREGLSQTPIRTSVHLDPADVHRRGAYERGRRGERASMQREMGLTP